MGGCHPQKPKIYLPVFLSGSSIYIWSENWRPKSEAKNGKKICQDQSLSIVFVCAVKYELVSNGQKIRVNFLPRYKE